MSNPSPPPERLTRQFLIKRIEHLENENARLRELLRAERKAADRWHDELVRLKSPRGLRVTDGDPL